MAIDLCNASPRISFSHDLCPTDVASVGLPREDSLLAESDDFDFCVADSFEHDSFSFVSCADELFSDGKILPQEIKKQQILPPKPPARHNASKKDKENGVKTEEKLLSPSLSSSASTSSASASTSTSASASSTKSLFWRLTRSSSCGSGYTRSLICNLPLLSRSNSTGSAPNRNPKPNSSSHNHNKNSSSKNTKLSSSSSTSSTSSASSTSYYPYSTSSKKNYGSKNNGIRVNPILNVPPPYISRGTVNLFGFGSLFCNGKEKEKNKKKRSTMVN